MIRDRLRVNVALARAHVDILASLCGYDENNPANNIALAIQSTPGKLFL